MLDVGEISEVNQKVSLAKEINLMDDTTQQALKYQNELLLKELNERNEELKREREKYKSLENKIEHTKTGNFTLHNTSADLNSSRYFLSMNSAKEGFGSSNKCSSRVFSRDEKESINWGAFNDT